MTSAVLRPAEKRALEAVVRPGNHIVVLLERCWFRQQPLLRLRYRTFRNLWARGYVRFRRTTVVDNSKVQLYGITHVGRKILTAARPPRLSPALRQVILALGADPAARLAMRMAGHMPMSSGVSYKDAPAGTTRRPTLTLARALLAHGLLELTGEATHGTCQQSGGRPYRIFSRYFGLSRKGREALAVYTQEATCARCD